MSSTEMIVKRRPSRPQAHREESPVMYHESDPAADHPAEPEHTAAAAAAEEAHEHLFHHDDEESDNDGEAHARHTAAPSAHPLPHHVEVAEEPSDDDSAASAPFDDEAPGAAGATMPPQAEKTARPQEAKPKKEKKAKKAKKTSKKKAAADAAAAPSSAPAAAAPKKKKPTRKVNLANVERQEPVAEGVNTPRSVALCEKHGVHPAELAPHPKAYFQGPGVDEEVAELRYHSYEKRRQARMAELLPAYRQVVRKSAAAHEEEAATSNGGEAEAEAEAQRPTAPPTDEEEEMRRQFEAQHQRLLEQERRKTTGGAYDSDGHRRSSARASYPRGLSPRPGGSAQLSPGRYSVTSAAVGRPTIDQPYSAVKIYSNSISAARPLTQSEAVMIEDINEREARRLDTHERAVIIQENKQLMHVERELEKQRRGTASVQQVRLARDRRQQAALMERYNRLNEAAARRQRLEEERQARLLESIQEKEARVHSNDPYASLMSRRRYSQSLSQRASTVAPLQRQAEPEPEPEPEVEQEQEQEQEQPVSAEAEGEEL